MTTAPDNPDLIQEFPPQRVKKIRPPEDAVWDEEREVFEQGSLDALDRRQGVWRAWNQEKELIGASRWLDDMPVQSVQFHPDGTVARDERTAAPSGAPLFRMVQKSAGESPHEFPEGDDIPENAFRIEYHFDAHGYMTDYRFFDRAGKPLGKVELYLAADAQTEQERYPDLAAASAEWTEKGRAFMDGINAWLDVMYKEQRDPDDPEPSDERGHMERVAVEAIERLNREGRLDELRRMFPPAYEPFSGAFWEKYGLPPSQLVALGRSVALARVGDAVYELSGATITARPGLRAIGRSPDRRYLAVATPEGVEALELRDGALHRQGRLAYPRNYGEAFHRANPKLRPEIFDRPERLVIADLKVLPDGRRVAMASSEGIFLLTPTGAELLYPDAEKLGEHLAHFQEATEGRIGDYVFDLGMRYPNIELSPDGKYLACGGMFRRGILANLQVFKEEGGRFRLNNHSGAEAFFPKVVRFHDRLPAIAFAATLYASIDTNWAPNMPNTTFRLSKSQLDTDREISDFAGGIRQAVGVVNCIEPYGDGFLLGIRGQGYIWHMSATENVTQLGYVHLGGSILAMDFAPDGRSLFVGTSCGQVIRLSVGGERDPNLITDMALRDERRFLFWRTFDPMVW